MRNRERVGGLSLRAHRSRHIGRSLVASCSLALLGALVAPTVAGAAPGGTTTGPPVHQLGGGTNSDPVLFVMCNFGSQFNYEPNSSSSDPGGLSYYDDLWVDPSSGGYHSMADYFDQVSFGQTNLNGSEILDGPNSNNGWYSMLGGTSPTSMVNWALGSPPGSASARGDRVTDCLNAASADITTADLNTFQSVVTVTPQVNTTAPGAIAVGQTSITVSSLANFPSAPFVADLGSNFTYVLVTGVDPSTNTLTLGTLPTAPTGTPPGSTAAFPANTAVSTVTADDFGSTPALSNNLCENNGVFSFENTAGSCYSFGNADVTAGQGSITEGVGDLAHEVGHSFGLVHSRTMGAPTSGYRDCWDQLSFDSCGESPAQPSEYPSTEAAPNEPIVGLDAINLEAQGWIPTASQDRYGGGQQTVNLHALSDPGALNGGSTPTLDMHIPAVLNNIEVGTPAPATGSGNPSISFPFSPSLCGSTPSGYAGSYQCINSDYFTVEYRQGVTPSGVEDWDYGAGGGCDAACYAGGNYAPTPGNAVVLHLHSSSNPLPDPTGAPYSFLVNTVLNSSSAPYFAGSQQLLPDDGGLAPSFGAAADQFADPATNTYLGVNAIDPNTWTAKVTVSTSPIVTALQYNGDTHRTYGGTATLSSQLAVTGSGAQVPNENVTLSLGSQTCTGVTDTSGKATCNVVLTQPPGTYPLTAAFGGSEAYAGTGPTSFGNFTVNPAPLTVTTGDASRNYGLANPPLTATLSGFTDGQTLATSDVTGSASCSTMATVTSPPGPYAITCTQGTLSSNDYSFGPFDSGTLTINKAPLTATANNVARIYGVANPPLLATLSGFNDGQTLLTSDVTGIANCSTMAALSSPPGPYSITCTTGSLMSTDYSFGPFESGTLTVNQAPLTVTANSVTRPYGTPNVLGATLSGFTDGQNLATSDVTGSASCSTTATLTSNPDPYPITCLVGTLMSTDYSFGPFVPGILTVVKAPTNLVVAPLHQGLFTYTFSADLTNAASGVPIPGQAVTFSVDGQPMCTGVTNSTGLASCTTFSLVVTLVASTYQASYDGKSIDFLPTTGTGVIPPLIAVMGLGL